MAKKNGEEKEVVVITLRIDQAAKKKLHTYCLQRSEEEGSRVSYNQAILEMIEASATKRKPKRASARAA